ncbi:uncharacterized protein LOC115766945 [Drosophila novamexicana]|uniref:uncharacterized protein LOC115766945 n=1 Tax=Drosophila novamexicana TaxID=47314 RepID=UPI0011E5EF29|nr:uncharacterized protein LOC115766945 [Drosophila novamexicana]
MWKFVCLMLLLAIGCSAGPLAQQQRKNMPIVAREDSAPAVQESDMEAEAEPEMTSSGSAAEAAPLTGTLTLPSNATSIRADITDNFSCANKSYGYYADVENDCQIFHVCLPVTYADGKENTFRWSFICPEETIFSQESFTCMRREDMTIECEDSSRYYELNGNFGLPVEEEKESASKPGAAATAESEEPDQPEESEVPAPAEPAAAVATPEPAKPVKVQKPKPKPNRRKPAPQRKAPVVATAAPVVEAIAEPEPEVVAVPVQQASKPPKPQRFSVRPNKDKPKPVVPATAAPVRNELFNAIRKRPAIFNKNSISSTAKPVQEAVEPAVTEAVVQAELNEPQPTLKLQTMFVEPAAQASEPVMAIALPELEAKPEPEEPEAAPEQTKLKEPMEEASPMPEQMLEMKPIEAIPEIPAVIVESLAEKPQEIENKLKMEVVTADSPIEPAIMEPSGSGEESLNNIEALEAAKPADAPVSLPATPEMANPSPLVEEMLGNNSEVQESLGGFKPVDPVMAAEAEQLITDFLNTLRNHEEKTETELANAAMDMAETETEAVSIEEAKLPEPDTVDPIASVEEQLLETETQQKQKPDSPIINIMQLNHLPADYQIPVQVVAAPEPEPEAAEESAKETEVKEAAIQDDAQESLASAAYMPAISIDDIVELVKERLDQNPKNEQLTPMELVLTPGAAAPMTLIESTAEQKPEEEQPAPAAALIVEPAPAAAEEDEPILPIYKRVSVADPAMSAAQTQPVTVSKVEAEATPQQEAIEVREPKSQTRMDARKRRFLFRADAS